MKQNNKNLGVAFFIFIIVLTMVSSCKKEDSGTEPTGIGNLKIEFDHFANNERLALGVNYRNSNGDTMKFSMFNYYVSNFSLVKSDGSVYVIPKDSCYFLIKEENTGQNREIEFKGIPAGDYKEIRFIIGVDSLKSVSPISERTGVLDPAGEAAGMYWMWNSGYIFVKVEGTSPQAPFDTNTGNHPFYYHIGLFGGYDSPTLNNIKNVTLSDDAGDVATVRTNITPNVHVKVDIMELFKTPTTVSMAEHPVVMVSAFSAEVANNYKDMFQIDHVHN